MKIAVTGATGHVGNNLCRLLLEKGHNVRALIHKDDHAIHDLSIDKIKGEITDPKALNELFYGADIVIHLAAKISITRGNVSEVTRVNVEGTRNAIRAAKEQKIKRYIHFSSIHALDHKPLDKAMDETHPLISENPLPYEITKAAGERLVHEAARNGLDALVINPTSIIGPNDFKPSLIGQAIIKIYNRQLPALVKGGYDWVDVRDVCNAVYNAIDKGRKGERYILSGKWAGLPEFAGIISKVTGRKTPSLVAPDWLARIGVPFMKFYASLRNEYPLYTSETLEIIKMGNTMISNEKARKELDFSNRSLETTLKDTIEWFKSTGVIK